MTKPIPADEGNAQPAASLAGTEAAACVGVGTTDDGSGPDWGVNEDDEYRCPVPGRDAETDLRVSVHEAFHGLALRLLNWPIRFGNDPARRNL